MIVYIIFKKFCLTIQAHHSLLNDDIVEDGLLLVVFCLFGAKNDFFCQRLGEQRATECKKEKHNELFTYGGVLCLHNWEK